MRKIKEEIYRSENFSDIKNAFKGGWKGFNLECPEEAAQIYIDKIKSDQNIMNLLSSNPVFQVNGVLLIFKNADKEVKESFKFSKQMIIGIPSGIVLIIIILGIILSIPKSEPEPVIIPELSKSIIVQDHIIPRECFITHIQTETGWYVWVSDINSDFEIHIEVPDYKAFIDEYLTKSKL